MSTCSAAAASSVAGTAGTYYSAAVVRYYAGVVLSGSYGDVYGLVALVMGDARAFSGMMMLILTLPDEVFEGPSGVVVTRSVTSSVAVSVSFGSSGWVCCSWSVVSWFCG